MVKYVVDKVNNVKLGGEVGCRAGHLEVQVVGHQPKQSRAFSS